MPFLNYDGQICSENKPLFTTKSKAFRLGEGLIETMLWNDGSVRLFRLHMERLTESLDTIGFPTFDEEEFLHSIHKTISANKDPEVAIVRAQFFKNIEDKALHYIIESLPFDHKLPTQKITVGITQKAIKCPDSISHLKTSSRMQYTIAKKDADEKGWNDALLLNPQGRVVEGTISNVFAVFGNNICTPPLNEGCINGVMRKYLLEHRSINHLSITEKQLDVTMLQQADEIFLTNAIKGIQPVYSFMNKEYQSTTTQMVADIVSKL
jgi:branched-subunit amino acid aminotransferase/4-amino-4-deoxychorismate lyase